MICNIIKVSTDNRKVVVSTGGKCILIEILDGQILQVGKNIVFEKVFEAQTMRHAESGELFSAEIEEMNFNCSAEI